MADWYKSGIEAFCKVVSIQLGRVPGISSWRNIVMDLMGESTLRAGKKDEKGKKDAKGKKDEKDRKDRMSKLWRLGRGHRVKEFEAEWMEPAEGGLPDDPLMACVNSIVGNKDSWTRDYFYDYAYKYDFLALAEAMAQGFVTEGFSESSARFFLSGIRAKLKGFSRSDGFIRPLMYTFIAGAIYGPDHPAAQGESLQDTVMADGFEADVRGKYAPIFGEKVIFTQLHGNDFVFAGDRESVDVGTVLFFGLNSSLEEYRNRLDGVLAENGIKLFSGVEYRAFSIPHDCDQVSRYHAAVFQLKDGSFGTYNDYGWYCVDLGSKNGTTVIDSAGSRSANVPISIEPGSRIVMGGDANDPHNAVIVASIPFRES